MADPIVGNSCRIDSRSDMVGLREAGYEAEVSDISEMDPDAAVRGEPKEQAVCCSKTKRPEPQRTEWPTSKELVVNGEAE